MNIKRFLTSRTFLKHLSLSIGITLAAILFILTILKFYTRHGESYPVPDLYGLTEDEFSRVLQKSGLRYEITDSTYMEEVVAGGVIDQVPEAGHQVKHNRIIFLTINSVAPEQVPVPRLTDISLRQSLSQLETSGLLPGEITYRPSEFHNLVLQATINGTEAKAGEFVSRGTRVDLVVGTGDNQEAVYLPDVKGLTLQMARQILSESMLNVGAVIYDASVVNRYDSINARVWRQHPDITVTSLVNTGSSIDLWVSLDESRFSGSGLEDNGKSIENESPN